MNTVAPRESGNLGAIVIWDSHPVQYKAPVYRELEALCPGLFTVIYGSDCSVRGHLDPGFGRRVAWDGSLLDGYKSTVLHKERGTALMGFRSLSGSGVHAALLRLRPRAVIISQFLYESDFAALISAGRLGVPVAIRQETQDEAFRRGRIKSFLRSVFYRGIYRRVDRAFFIGELNREHLLRHGFASHQLTRSPYCTPSFIDGMSDGERARARQSRREAMGIGPEQIVILFSGKLIAKKNPDLLLEAVEH
jgi:hypothetical protein